MRDGGAHSWSPENLNGITFTLLPLLCYRFLNLKKTTSLPTTLPWKSHADLGTDEADKGALAWEARGLLSPDLSLTFLMSLFAHSLIPHMCTWLSVAHIFPDPPEEDMGFFSSPCQATEKQQASSLKGPGVDQGGFPGWVGRSLGIWDSGAAPGSRGVTRPPASLPPVAHDGPGPQVLLWAILTHLLINFESPLYPILCS